MKKYIYISFMGLFFIAISGCEDYLEEDIKTFTDPQSLMQSKTGIEAMISGAYNIGSGLYRSRNMHLLYTLTTDEAFFQEIGGSRYEMATYEFSPSNGDVGRAWNEYTRGIVHANIVLDYLPDVGELGISGEKRYLETIKGEALFLRARHHFYHMNTYGPVPLLTTSVNVDLYPANSTIPEIYAQIISDLSEAETLIPGWDDHQAGRANRGAAKSLLGRVYLTKATSEAKAADDFQKAASKFKEVIDNEGYDLWDNYKEVFLPENKNKKEDIHSFQNEISGGWWLGNVMYIEFSPRPTPAGGTTSYGNIPMSELLFNSFEAGDKRKEDGWSEDGSHGYIYTGDYVDRLTGEVLNTNLIYHEKYLDPINSANTHAVETNFPLIRYADVLLMYAEAINEVNGPNSESYWAINKVRARAGLDPLSGLSKTEFFDALVTERFHEFFHEGIRWFDLKRWNLIKERVLMREHIPGYPDPLTIELPKHLVLPIPQYEIDANPNLVQNPGY